jgi:diamine N-acetyltransferase
MKITIRQAHDTDYHDILLITIQVHNVHTDNRKDIYKENGNPLDFDDFKLMLGIPEKYRIIVAVNDSGKILGYAIIQIQYIKDNKILKDAKVYFIDSIAIDEEYKRNGIGKEMMNWIKNEAVNNMVNRIVLNVWSFNKDAINFYDKIGMKKQAIKYEFVL